MKGCTDILVEHRKLSLGVYGGNSEMRTQSQCASEGERRERRDEPRLSQPTEFGPVRNLAHLHSVHQNLRGKRSRSKSSTNTKRTNTQQHSIPRSRSHADRDQAKHPGHAFECSTPARSADRVRYVETQGELQTEAKERSRLSKICSLVFFSL